MRQMNDKIKQLALKANPASKEIYQSDSWKFNCAAWTMDELQHFAELIINECCEHVRKMDAMEIKQKFGISEE